jgi:hypothetical protein
VKESEKKNKEWETEKQKVEEKEDNERKQTNKKGRIIVWKKPRKEEWNKEGNEGIIGESKEKEKEGLEKKTEREQIKNDGSKREKGNKEEIQDTRKEET